MPSQDDETIRERAFSIWEHAGRPEGQALDHWLRAEAALFQNSPHPGNTKNMAENLERPATGMVIACKRCSTENAEGSRFCTGCGAPLGREWEAIDRIIDERLEHKIRSTLKSEFGDQKSLEIETAERIAERAQKWAKTFAFFVGIPVAVVTAFISFLGIKTLSDVTAARDKLGSATTALIGAQTQVDSANQKAKDVLADADNFRSQIRGARDQLASIPELQERQAKLETALKNFVNRGTSNTSINTLVKIDGIVSPYKQYLTTIGLALPDTLPGFEIQDNVGTMLSYYDPSENLIAVYKGVIDDSSVWLRDFTHQVLFNQPLASSQPSALSGQQVVDALYRVESILGYYLPCSFLNTPMVGELAAKLLGTRFHLYVIDFSKKTDFSDYGKLTDDQKPYQGAEIVGAIFWQIRGIMDHELADRLLVSTWLAFIQESENNLKVETFLKTYMKQFESSELTRYKTTVQDIFREHNLTL